MSGVFKPLQHRYGSAWKDPLPDWNATLDTLLSHRSVRAYLPDPVSEDTLHTLVAAAQSASTSSNTQVWSVIAVQDPERKARLARFAADQKQIHEAPLLLVWLADLARHRRVADSMQRSADGLRYLESFLMAVIDAALAAQNAAVAAESLGLGTCYIGAMRNKPEEVARELNLPPEVFAVFGLCVGRPDPARPASIKPRLPQSVVLHREQYRAVSLEEVQRYDEIMRGFNASQNMKVEGWSQRSTARLRGAESLNGRDRLREALAGFGFDLL